MTTAAVRLHYVAAIVLSFGLLAGTARAAAVPAWPNLAAELPSGPGDAGCATLAGVDVNDNGVRDDLERHIAQHFGDDPRVRRAVANAVIATQQGILATDDDDSRAAQTMLLHVGDCMGAIGPILAPYGDALWRLRRLIDDTPERRAALEAHMGRVMRMDDIAREEPGWGERCERRVDEAVGGDLRRR
ncbi:hypothetical protein ACFFTM_11515 [Pseudoduganella plicata]|uniref:Uncharacterized protein n=1 Tax=Pseudoduganella plicata TaxID=321984 RepID=A0A4P7BEN3_9BURK|nr:hypothetical protein [Pseudoduganella plicata]QBQ35935.1 hypothetical protein E1742_07065 [Pseudoduganella plicata]GGY79352.1 hypothetical protein GCM10007388_10490 [Pseudoduganella plicata]